MDSLPWLLATDSSAIVDQASQLPEALMAAREITIGASI